MDMMLNSLPARTWNRLGINETFLKIEEKLDNYIPEAALNGQNILWNPDAGMNSGWENIKTGMGKDVGTLIGEASAGLAETAEGVVMDAPLTLNYRYADKENAASRLRLHAGKDSVMKVVMYLHNDSDFTGTSAIRTEMHAEAGAKIQLYVVQLLGTGCVCLNDIGGVCEENASIELIKLELGAGQMYAGTWVDLKGRESRFYTNVGYHVREKQRLDMNYAVEHHAPDTNSLIEVLGTLEEDAHKTFRGTIDFPLGCPGSKGTESENVLLLGDRMINQSIPLILCKEEDVEGNHGASIGRLDDKILFYLSSRGFTEEDAQQMIAQSRIAAICDKVPDEEVRAAVHDFKI